MARNPITDEIRDIRHRLAEQFDNDVRRIGAELRRRQSSSVHRVVRLPARQPVTAANKAVLAESGSRDPA